MAAARPPRTELVWPGKGETPTPAGNPPSLAVDPARDLLVRGDNLDVLRTLAPRLGGKIDLVYLDPPFATGDVFAVKPRGAAADLAAGPAYRDRFGATPDAYLRFMEPRLALVRELLAADGSLLLHCDFRASHLLGLLCDELFGRGDRGPRKGEPGFRNEIVWCYGLGGSSPRFYPRKHDVILWYTKGERWTFTAPRTAATSARLKGRTKKRTDVFDDVPSLNNMARERTGYPTQKPLALLERFVLAHTRAGGFVADFFAGSGTTLVAAARHGRRWLGCDAGAAAVRVAERRLLAEPNARPFDVVRLGDPTERRTPP
jgi:hypothetical protein